LLDTPQNTDVSSVRAEGGGYFKRYFKNDLTLTVTGRSLTKNDRPSVAIYANDKFLAERTFPVKASPIELTVPRELLNERNDGTPLSITFDVRPKPGGERDLNMRSVKISRVTLAENEWPH
jgi:hypothetical protein